MNADGTALGGLRKLPAGRLARLLGAEAPQVSAAVLLTLPEVEAAGLLGAMDADTRRRAVRCLSRTQAPAAAALATVDRVLSAAAARVETDGREALERILAHAAPDLRAELVAVVEAAPSSPPPAEREAGPDWTPPELPPGLAAIVNSARVDVDRMPMLEVVFDRFVRMLATSLRTLTGARADVSLLGLWSVRFGDWLNGETQGRPLVPFRADPWNDYGLLAVDRALVESVGEALLGGDPARAGERVAERPLSGLDLALAEEAVRTALADFGAAFQPVAAVRFDLDRVELCPRFATITRPFNGCMRARIMVALDGRGGGLDVILPYALLEPVRPLLRSMFMGERFGRDPLWHDHLREEALRSLTTVRAVAGTALLPLADLLAFRPGAVFALDAGCDGAALLDVAGRVVGTGRVGASGHRWAIAINPLPDGAAAPTPVDLPAAAAMTRAAVPTALHAAGVRLSVVIGGAERSLGDIQRLARGGLLVLDRRVDEPVEIQAEGRTVARGELVATDGRAGVRLVEVAGNRA